MEVLSIDFIARPPHNLKVVGASPFPGTTFSSLALVTLPTSHGSESDP